jgi:hypothetical protein
MAFRARALVTAIRSKTSSSVQYCIFRKTRMFAWCHAHPDAGPAFVAAIAVVLTNAIRMQQIASSIPSPSGYWTSSVIGRMFCKLSFVT